ncbi:uracil-DNA glycosylase family protein [Lactobacillus terrae]|uniref:uracil-DNA glycosylase family protein n=1 Tax=Lactobacillus terrae TaxID=2269374 RepID=UPI000C1B639C|nr:uracil-DNA glycosylase family protein [Lactobacillus terrae]
MDEEEIFNQIKNDPENKEYTVIGWDPLFAAPPTAEILIVGQAPSKKVQESNIMWNDKSGDRLRDWMGIDRNIFYDSKKIAIIPMDFYYPGKGKSGDLPPRKDIAEKWHPKLLDSMPNIQLTILIGMYAQKYYLNLQNNDKITDVVKNYQNYLPKYFPIVHPSPRNNIWLAKNEWFEEDVIPALQQNVKNIIKRSH